MGASRRSRRVEHHGYFIVGGTHGLEVARIEKGLEAVTIGRIEIRNGRVGRQGAAPRRVAEHVADPGVVQNERDGLGGKLMVEGNSDESRPEDAEIGDHVLGPVGREDGDPVAAHQAARQQPARAGVGQVVDLPVRIFARMLPIAAVDQRGAVTAELRVEQGTKVIGFDHAGELVRAVGFNVPFAGAISGEDKSSHRERKPTAIFRKDRGKAGRRRGRGANG